MVYGAALEQSNKQKASDERLGGGLVAGMKGGDNGVGLNS